MESSRPVKNLYLELYNVVHVLDVKLCIQLRLMHWLKPNIKMIKCVEHSVQT